MAGFDLEKYIPVHERIAQFWKQFPEGSIETSADYPDEQTVRVRAIACRQPGVLGATGHAEEVRGGYINKDSALENCETSAVGRALAMMGFEINRGIASRSEMEKVQRLATVQDAMSDAHVALIDRLVGLTGDQIKQATKLKLIAFGAQDVNTPRDAVSALTEGQAVEVLEWLEGEENKANEPEAIRAAPVSA